MKALIDAQLPRRLAHRLREEGWDVLHTLDLPEGNRTSDSAIMERADSDSRVVITKDADFVISHVLSGRPARLLLVSTGNISNRDLEALLLPRLSDIQVALSESAYIEVTPTLLIVHG